MEISDGWWKPDSSRREPWRHAAQHVFQNLPHVWRAARRVFQNLPQVWRAARRAFQNLSHVWRAARQVFQNLPQVWRAARQVSQEARHVCRAMKHLFHGPRCLHAHDCHAAEARRHLSHTGVYLYDLVCL